ncbi:hypothetical protein BGZ83_007390 [Gryganskiella cystojenkinii]|nr:hypothetical protein BGZ83_007390 [Gryganskiella cystojenkinii]
MLYYSTLPTNLGICPGYTATGILIDKPRTQRQQPSTGATLTSKPLKRFSSVGGSQRSNNLTVNTTVSTPSRTVGLSICPSSGSSTDTRYRILCRNEVVFANEKHPLVQSLDATTTPPTSKDDFAGGSSTSDRTDDQPPRASMVFSIKMKYSRTRPQSSVTQAAEHFLSQGYSSLDGLTASGSNRHPAQIQLQPVLLHRCYPIHQQGRISLTETTEREDSFRLDIHAWSKSLELSSPIELEVSVVTSPVRQIAFGNSDVIRNGEDVLLEGLALARTMAQQAGWKCLEEDDSSMIEWVRDEMSIQWSSERVSNQDQWQSVCSNVEGVKRPRRSRTVSNGSESSSMPGHRRHSTLERLKEASETLLEHEAQSKEDHLTAKDGKESADQKSSKVTIAAVEPVSPQRPGIKTSFGGFSSLNESRSHSLALAEETEDHLGVALSIPSSNGGQTSPKDRQDQVAGAKFFGEGITPAEIIGTDLGNESPLSSNPSPPEPRKLSRFSIKSYRMERDNTGLSDEWGLGSLNASSLFPTPPSSTSSLKKNDLLTTPPLLAETTSSLGSVSPLSPSAPGEGQVQDFLSGSNASPPKFGSGVSRPQQFGKNLFSGTSSSSTISSTDDQPKTVSESSNQIDNSSRRSFGVFGPRQSFSAGGKAVGSSSSTGNSGISPLDAPVELIPDFLGASFPAPKTLSGRKESVSAGGTSLARVQSTPSVSAVKAVHFADSGVDGEDGLRRVESDPCTAQLQKASLGDVEDDTDMQATLDALRRPSLTTDFSMSSSRSSSSTSSSSSKSKAHTRRSWGQGIGGSDIQGIQGLE